MRSKKWQTDSRDIYVRVVLRFLHGELDARSFALVFFDLWGTQPPVGKNARSDALHSIFGLLEGLECLEGVDSEALKRDVSRYVGMSMD